MLTARPLSSQKAPSSLAAGLQHLNLSRGKDGVLFVPSSLRPGPAPLVLTLHGAWGNGVNGLSHLIDQAEQYGLILLSPDSKGTTWDVLRSGFGPDVTYINSALQHVFDRYAIVPNRVVCSGFSDGASYALSLGVTNGSLFSQIVAFSPGFMRPMSYNGKPLVYVSHGDNDRVLSVERCSRRIVPQLQSRGYRVTYHEFKGGHTVPTAIAREGMEWVLQNGVDMGGAGSREG